MTDSIETKDERTYVKLKDLEKILPQVKKIVEDLQVLDKTIDLLDTVEMEIDEANFDKLRYITRFNKAFHKLSYEFYHKLDQLENMGCVIKDLGEGLVDFLYQFGERDVFLCWKVGEDEVEYWHEIDEGYIGRRKILDLDKKIF